MNIQVYKYYTVRIRIFQLNIGSNTEFKTKCNYIIVAKFGSRSS